jgi:16S rRNA (adenine1518-N6/adenine1519-N6)-dimethyltransferase
MRKKYGQNFLVRAGAREKLIHALEVKRGDEVWEIGPGLGAMTGGLLEAGAMVKAFEIDPAFSAVLGDLFGEKENFSLVRGDVKKTWRTIRPLQEYPLLLGNLPYNIGAGLLGDFIEGGRLFRRVVVPLQREVARRIMAGPGTADYSSLSVLCASSYTVTPLMVLKGSAFYPAPRVDSQGLRLDLRDGRPEPPPLFYPLVRRLFSSRRKTLRNNLTGFLSSLSRGMLGKGRGITPAEGAMESLALGGISGDLRAEKLAPGDFISLALAINRVVSGESA